MSQKSHSLLSPYFFRLSHQIFQVSPLKLHTALATFRWTQVVPSAARLAGFVWFCFFFFYLLLVAQQLFFSVLHWNTTRNWSFTVWVCPADESNGLLELKELKYTSQVL